MTVLPKISIEFFTDILCIWAYGTQVWLDELKKDFPGQIDIHYRFIPLFAATCQRMQSEWGHRGGYKGFNHHLHGIIQQWDHVELHPEVWLNDPPSTSLKAHLYLVALRKLQECGQISREPHAEFSNRSYIEEAVWRLRCAFFQHARNIARDEVLDEIFTELGIPLAEVHAMIASGDAYACLHLDNEAKHSNNIPGSPTMIFNAGRQRLYGNVGYRILETNIRECLTNERVGDASWC